MSDTQKAKRAVITISGIEIEAFELPDGERVLSQRQTAKAVGKFNSSLNSFLHTKQAKALLGNVLALNTIQIEGNNAYIQVVPIDIANAYWMAQAMLGNELAGQLCLAN